MSIGRISVDELVERINAADQPKCVLYLSGGGTEVLPWLLARGGGSNTLLSAHIPYSQNDFRSLLGYDPGRMVDARAARGLAMAAFRHALTIRGDLEPEQVFGVGSTSKLASKTVEREGRTHEIHIALHSCCATDLWSIVLPQGHDRAWEEQYNALFLLNVIAWGKHISDQVSLESDEPERTTETGSFQAATVEGAIVDLLVGRRSWVAWDCPPHRLSERFQWSSVTEEIPKLLLPGSFRPLHAGHIAMVEAASKLLGVPCHYEISLFHPEKPPLDYLAIDSRLSTFEGQQARVFLTNAPTYLEKARLFPGCTFAVGHDTAERIIDPRFYGSPAARDAMLAELTTLGARFLVFGRVDASGNFRDFASQEFEESITRFLVSSVTSVSADHFRVDLSSTEVRQRSSHDYA